jgi:hypothetical protein
MANWETKTYMRVFTFLKHRGIYVIRLAVTCGHQLNIILAIKFKEDKMGRACSTHWGEGKFIQLLGGET